MVRVSGFIAGSERLVLAVLMLTPRRVGAISTLSKIVQSGPVWTPVCGEDAALKRSLDARVWVTL